jgi:hypothetical protein
MIFVEQLLVGKSGLRIFVEHPRIGAGGSSVEIIVKLFDVFAVVALRIGQAEEALFENGVLAIPQRDAEAEVFFLIAKTGEAVFSPTIGATASVFVRKVIPRRAVGAVVFADRAPLALAQVSAPATPEFDLAGSVVEANSLGVGYSLRVG